MSVALAKVKMDVTTSPSRSVRNESREGSLGGESEGDPSTHTCSNENKNDHLKDSIASTISKIKVEFNGTPRTEASSPDSRDETLEAEDDEAEICVCGGNVVIRQSGSTGDTTNKDNVIIPERRMMNDEMPMSQTDQHIHQLDRDGELNEVAGSQSMLSQELIYDMQRHNRLENRSGDDDDDDGKSSVGCVSSLLLSQETETSISMAKRLGLLPMTQDEEESEEDAKLPVADGGTSAAISTKNADDPCTPKRSGSLLSVLSHASRIGAPDLASFSAKKEIIAAENKPIVDITDTPVRESEGFGSLLDAVAKITEQEISEGEDALLWRRTLYLQPDAREICHRDMLLCLRLGSRHENLQAIARIARYLLRLLLRLLPLR
jgi:hypothetical protein